MMTTTRFAAAAAVFIGLLATPTLAQVRYRSSEVPVPPSAAATPYGYPVPGGFLQPNETLGTSSTFLILPYAPPGTPEVRVIQRCQYPNGWNITDFDRDLNGVPAGVGHTCPGSPTYGLGGGYRRTNY